MTLHASTPATPNVHATPPARTNAERERDELRLLSVFSGEPTPALRALELAEFIQEGRGEEPTAYHRHLLYQAVRQYQTIRKVNAGHVLTGIGEARLATLQGLHGRVPRTATQQRDATRRAEERARDHAHWLRGQWRKGAGERTVTYQDAALTITTWHLNGKSYRVIEEEDRAVRFEDVTT